MRFLHITLLGLSACLFSGATAVAGTYYVSATASTSTTWAQAQNPTTPCTASRAMTNASAGDTVYFRAGTYGSTAEPANYQPAKSGTASAAIVFSAYTGETPLIVGGFLVNGKQWIRLSGFTLRGGNPPPANWQDMPAVVVDDPSVGPISPDEDWSTREAKVRRKYATFMAWYDSISENWTSGIDLVGASHVTVSNNTLSNYASGVNLRGASSFVTVENNEVHHCYIGIFSYEQNYTVSISVSDSIIRGNHCHQTMDSGIGISFGAHRVTIESNRCEFNALSHIATHHGTSAITIRGNVVAYGGYYTETMEWPGSSALNAGFGADSLVIEGNRASFQLDSMGWDGNGIIIDTNDDLGPIAIAAVVRNNILYRNQGSGITLTRSRNCTVVNNTCVENGYNASSPYNGAGLRLSQTQSTGSIAANNIFSDNSRGALWLDGPFGDQASIDYNLYRVTSGSLSVARDSAHSYTTVAAFRTATGREQHGVQAVPNFAGTLDFHLVSPSPAINAGTPTYAPPIDLDGVSRDASPDLGAYEYIPPATYATWRTANFSGADLTNDAISGPNADPDGAGLTNYGRYAFALPSRGRVVNPVTLGTINTGGQNYLTLTFNRRAAATDLSYSVESSADLTIWTAVPGLIYTPGSGPITAQDAVAIGSGSRRFLRLRITGSP